MRTTSPPGERTAASIRRISEYRHNESHDSLFVGADSFETHLRSAEELEVRSGERGERFANNFQTLIGEQRTYYHIGDQSTHLPPCTIEYGVRFTSHIPPTTISSRNNEKVASNQPQAHRYPINALPGLFPLLPNHRYTTDSTMIPTGCSMKKTNVPQPLRSCMQCTAKPCWNPEHAKATAVVTSRCSVERGVSRRSFETAFPIPPNVLRND